MSTTQARRVAVVYPLAAALILATAGLRAALDPVLGDAAPLVLFLIPVSIAAWFGGLGPGLLATGLGVVLGVLLFAPGRHLSGPHGAGFQLLVRGVPFVAVGVSISLLAAQSEGALRRAAASAAAAEAARLDAEAARQDAEAASRAKDLFLSVLSHELRTPLTPVLAAAGLLAQDPAVPPHLADQVDVIRRNVQTETRLVDDLLDLTRIGRGKIQLRREVVDAHAVVRDAVATAGGDAAAKGVAVTVALGADRPHVWADPARLQQMVLNLLTNAVKFTPAGGTVAVRTSDGRGDGGDATTLRVEVADTGIGIAADVLPRLFQPFEQGDQAMTRRFGGLGLGLSIVRSLALMHGATVTAASDGVGRGSTFALGMPSVPPPAAAAATGSPVPTPAAAADRPACRVLLVEDHADTRRVMAKVLTTFGHQVTATGSVREAVEAADRQPFDLLLSDINLPDGTGMDVMRHVGGRPGLVGIALSGFGQDEDLQRSRAAGFAMHLIKPVTVQALRDTIDAHVARPSR